MNNLVRDLRETVANDESLSIKASKMLEKAANRIEELERERTNICNLCND